MRRAETMEIAAAIYDKLRFVTLIITGRITQHLTNFSLSEIFGGDIKMATASATHIEPILRESVDPVIDKQYEEKVMLKKRIPKASENINTRGVRVDVYLRPNPSFNWFPMGGAFPTP